MTRGDGWDRETDYRWPPRKVVKEQQNADPAGRDPDPGATANGGESCVTRFGRRSSADSRPWRCLRPPSRPRQAPRRRSRRPRPAVFAAPRSEGCARAADFIGRDSGYYAMHIKKQDLYEPCRANLAWCLGTTTSTRGGGHTTGAVEVRPGMDDEKLRKIFGVPNPENLLEYEGRAKMVVFTEGLHRVANCLGICHFNTIWRNLDLIDLPQMAEMYSAATGWSTSVDDLKRMAERQLNLEKAFNLRFTSFGRTEDLPTPRDLAEPIPTGLLAGWKMDADKFNQMLDEYYDLHGWDKGTSYPKRRTLAGLGLESVADDLERINKLGNP